MNNQTYKDFQCEYPFAGSTWGFKIAATSHAEAVARIKQMPFAKVKGEIKMIIPLGPERLWRKVFRLFGR